MADESIVGRIALELGVNTKDFKKQLSGLGGIAKNASNGISKALGGIAKAAAVAFSVKAIVNFGKECLELGSDLAEVQNVVDVTFGSISESVNEWAKAAMESYGMSEKVAKEYMGQFGAMSKAFVNTEQMAYDQAAALTGLAGDVASFYNMSTDEAFSKLKAVYTGETEGLKSLGVVMTQTALEEYAVQKGIGKTISAMSEQEKVALRLSFVQDKLAGASGDFVRTADGWANQTRVLSLRFDALKASIGQGLINILTPVIRLLNELVAYLQVAADAFSSFTTMLFGDAGSTSSQMEGVSAATESIAENLGGSASAAKSIKKSLAGFDQINTISSGNSDDGGSVIEAPSSSLGSAVESSKSKVTDGAIGKLDSFLKEAKKKLVEFSNLSGLTNFWKNFKKGLDYAKIGVLRLFSAFKGAIAANMPNIEGLTTSFVNAFLTMSNATKTIFGDIWLTCMQAFARFAAENHGALQEFFSGIIGTVTGAVTLVSDVIGGFYSTLLDWWNTSGIGLWKGIVEALKDIGRFFLDLWNDWIQPVIDTVIGALRELWEKHIRPLWKEVLDVFASVGNAIVALWNNPLKPLIDFLITSLGPAVSAVFSGIASIVGRMVGNIIDVVKNLIKIFRGLLDFIGGVFTADWKKAWNGIKTFFGGIWDSMVSILKIPLNLIIGLFEGFMNCVIGAVNGIIRAVNKLSFDVPDWVPGIGGQTFGFNLNEMRNVSLPHLATGGYVAANTPQLAIVGDNKREGEIIAPESKIAEAVARGFAMVMSKFQTQNTAQNNRPMYITLKLGEDTFWEGFVDYHNSIVKRTGETPLMV